MYKTNSEGKVRCKYVRRNVLQILVFVPIAHAIIIVPLYYSIGTKSMLFFYFVLVYVFGFLIFSFWSAFRQLKRQNRTITEMDAIDENIIIKTDKILWLNAKEYDVQKNNLQIKNRTFDWYSVKETKKEGMSITINGNELYLVKDYFDKYDEIFKILNAK